MDAIDRQIVALLREDARRSYQDIGQRVSLSAPAVKRRVDRLESEGVIRGYSANLDPAAFGWDTHAFVELFCEGGMSRASFGPRPRWCSRRCSSARWRTARAQRDRPRQQPEAPVPGRASSTRY